MERPDAIDFRRLLEQWKQKWYWFAVSIVACLSLGFIYTVIKKPVYMVKANIVVSQEDKSALAGMSGISNLFGSGSRVDDEVFVVQSHTGLKTVARNLKLDRSYTVRKGFLRSASAYRDYPVELIPAADYADTLSVALCFKVKVTADGNVNVRVKADRTTIADTDAKSLPMSVATPYGDFTLRKTPSFTEGKSLRTDIVYQSYDAVAEGLYEDVMVDIASRKSNVIKMEIKTTDIEYAKNVLDEIVSVYNSRGISERNAEGEKTLEFINSRISILENDLADSEHDTESYKKGNRIIDVQSEAMFQSEKRAKLEESLVTAETELEILKMTNDFLTDPDNRYELIPTTVATQTVANGINEYNTLIMRRINLSHSAREGNPALKNLNGRIDALRDNILTSLSRAVETQRVVVSDLKNNLGGTRARLGNIPTQEREYRTIQRKQSIKEQLYIFLLTRKEETAMMIANATPKGIIVDDAYSMQEPVSMKRSTVMLIALILGLIIPPAAICVRNLLRNKFDSMDELERHTDIPVIGEISTEATSEKLVVRQGIMTSTAELFRLVRTNLLFMLAGARKAVILMTSTRSGEGKSFVTINLAASLSLLGKRVIVVGADIRKPRLAQYLSLTDHKGLTEYLSTSSVNIDDIVIKDSDKLPFDIIISGPVPPNPSELLMNDRVNELFDGLRSRYDYVIIDSAPVGMVSDTFTLCRVADTTIYVVRANYTSLTDICYANSLYTDKRLPRMSLLINGTKAHGGYGYGYGDKSGKKH